MTFKELYLSGQVPFEEIDRYISRWNRSDDERTLAKYLGLNADEEDVWIDDSDEALKEMLDLVFVHIGTDVAVIAVAQDRDIIEKHIRSLQTELVEPAVFGDRVF